MDPMALAGMVFSLVVLLMIGGFVLLIPLSKRLGQLIELRIEERRASSHLPVEELRELHRMVQGLQSEVTRLAERQQFTERLLESGHRDRGQSIDSLE